MQTHVQVKKNVRRDAHVVQNSADGSNLLPDHLVLVLECTSCSCSSGRGRALVLVRAHASYVGRSKPHKCSFSTFCSLFRLLLQTS